MSKEHAHNSLSCAPEPQPGHMCLPAGNCGLVTATCKAKLNCRSVQRMVKTLWMFWLGTYIIREMRKGRGNTQSAGNGIIIFVCLLKVAQIKFFALLTRNLRNISWESLRIWYKHSHELIDELNWCGLSSFLMKWMQFKFIDWGQESLLSTGRHSGFTTITVPCAGASSNVYKCKL